MSDFDKILSAHEFVTNQLQKAKPANLNALSWRQEEINALVEEFRLTVYSGDKSYVFTFTEKELIEGYGTKIWEKRLTRRVKEVLAEI